MQQGRTILSRRNTKSKCGILKVCLDAFSSKRSHTEFYTNNYKQSRSIGFSLFTFTGKAPRKGNRAPLNQIKYSEERDEEKEMSGGHFASERGEEPRSGIQYCSSPSFTNFGARYMDHELMTMWLSVDPMAGKYPSISPYAYCAWNPVKLVDPDGREIDASGIFDDNGKARKGCEIAAKALISFANSKFGHRALSLFAKKGDKVGNVSFDKDGLFHEKGIDLSFNVATLKDCGGETGHKLTGSGKSKRLMLSVNLDTPVCGSDKDNIIRSLETICHEMFFHVFNYANDFDDDQNLNNSEISEYYRKECASDPNAMQEYHDLYVTHRYRDFAIPIMQEHLNSTREEAIATLNRTRGINMRNCPNWHKK